MPDISLPEVRLKDKLPEGLRDMTMDDIQKALPDVRMPKFDVGRDARKASRAAEKAAAKAARQVDRTARDVQKAAPRGAGDAAKTVQSALPSRPGPNPVPVAMLAMLGGLVVGWILANNPTTGPRIAAWMDELRARFDEWRGRGMSELDDEEWDTAEPQAYTESLRAPISPEPYVSNLAESDTAMATSSGELPDGMGTSDTAQVGADDRL
jgi:hypothetical protein